MISGLWSADSGWDRSPSEVGSFPAGSCPVPRFPSPQALGQGSSGLSGRLIAGFSFTCQGRTSNRITRSERSGRHHRPCASDPDPAAAPGEIRASGSLGSVLAARRPRTPLFPRAPPGPSCAPTHAHSTSADRRRTSDGVARLASYEPLPLLRPDRGSGVAIEQRARARRRESPPGSADRDREPTPPSRDQDFRSRGSRPWSPGSRPQAGALREVSNSSLTIGFHVKRAR